jgi:hypothetical protein
MGFPGTLLASERSDQTAIANIMTDELVPSISASSTTDTAVALSAKNVTTDKTVAPTDETLTDEVPTDETPATDATSTDVTGSDNTKTTPIVKEKKILKELVDKREANVKYFLMDDMTEEADVYSVPVHYQIDGQWKEIDNSMIEANDNAMGNGGYSNKTNDFKINIAKDTTSNKLINLKKDKYEVSWNIENVEKSTAQVINDNTDKIQATLSDEEKKKFVKNLDSSVTFPDIFQDMDLNYNINSNSLKENIVIKKPTDVNTFTLDLSTKNVLPQLMKDNSVVFYDNDKSNDEAFTFKAPVMYDANGNTSKDISIKLSKKDNDYSLTITPNQEWLKDSNRVYPIK